MKELLLFEDQNAKKEKTHFDKPIGILFLTSLRDIALEEYNGQMVMVDGKLSYMKGAIEHITKETKPKGKLFGFVEVKGVVVDDTKDDLNGRFTLLPEVGSPWIFPLNLKTKGILLKDKVWNIPSTFRKLPKEDIQGRKKAKYDFENAVLSKMQEIDAHIIISDGYMARIDYLQNELGMYGKILNIHPGPAISGMKYCFRGKNENMDAIRFAQKFGKAKTGATLHFINGEIDEGNAIAYICNTKVSSHDTEVALMYRNYKKAKLPVLTLGLKHYAKRIYPYLKRPV